ncbi:MAG: DUF2059 domain-containing protein [Opitutales bacterium]
MKNKISTYLILIFLTASFLHADTEPNILLRGILKMGDTQAFSISKKGGTNSTWLKIGQSDHGYTLKSFDEESEVLTVEADGETFELTMAGSTLSGDGGSPEERLAEAQRMMSLMNFEKMMDDMIGGQMKGMGDMMRQQMAGMGVEADEELIEFQTKAVEKMFSSIDWKPIKEGMTQVYADVFTKEELEGMSSFYTSPSGQASLEKMPEVQQKTMQVMMPAIMQASQQMQKDMMQFMQQRRQKTE